MAVVLGKNVFIYSGTSGTTALIAAAKSCTISMSCDTVEKASAAASAATAKEYVAGRTSWEVSLNHLVMSDGPFAGLLKVGTSFSISVMIGTTRKTGTVICTQADISGSVGSLATGQVKLLGTGALS